MSFLFIVGCMGRTAVREEAVKTWLCFHTKPARSFGYHQFRLGERQRVPRSILPWAVVSGTLHLVFLLFFKRSNLRCHQKLQYPPATFHFCFFFYYISHLVLLILFIGYWITDSDAQESNGSHYFNSRCHCWACVSRFFPFFINCEILFIKKIRFLNYYFFFLVRCLNKMKRTQSCWCGEENRARK